MFLEQEFKRYRASHGLLELEQARGTGLSAEQIENRLYLTGRYAAQISTLQAPSIRAADEPRSPLEKARAGLSSDTVTEVTLHWIKIRRVNN